MLRRPHLPAAARALPIALALSLAGCRDAPERPAAAAGAPAAFARAASKEPPVLAEGDRWNLLLVTLDTVRADVMTELGAAQVVAPNLEQLAAEGVLVDRTSKPPPLAVHHPTTAPPRRRIALFSDLA